MGVNDSTVTVRAARTGSGCSHRPGNQLALYAEGDPINLIDPNGTNTTAPTLAATTSSPRSPGRPALCGSKKTQAERNRWHRPARLRTELPGQARAGYEAAGPPRRLATSPQGASYSPVGEARGRPRRPVASSSTHRQRFARRRLHRARARRSTSQIPAHPAAPGMTPRPERLAGGFPRVVQLRDIPLSGFCRSPMEDNGPQCGARGRE